MKSSDYSYALVCAVTISDRIECDVVKREPDEYLKKRDD
jgi:hypothetical protein